MVFANEGGSGLHFFLGSLAGVELLLTKSSLSCQLPLFYRVGRVGFLLFIYLLSVYPGFWLLQDSVQNIVNKKKTRFLRVSEVLRPTSLTFSLHSP